MSRPTEEELRENRELMALDYLERIATALEAIAALLGVLEQTG